MTGLRDNVNEASDKAARGIEGIKRSGWSSLPFGFKAHLEPHPHNNFSNNYSQNHIVTYLLSFIVHFEFFCLFSFHLTISVVLRIRLNKLNKIGCVPDIKLTIYLQ